MRIFITGATGLIGRRLTLDRLRRGDHITVLSRDADRATRLFAADVNTNVNVVQGDPLEPGEWQRAVDGCDAVVNLAGAGLSDRRWNAAYKKLIEDSRVLSTRHVVEAVAGAHHRPTVLINGSAIGIYPDMGKQPIDESVTPGEHFLARVCVRWEREAQAAAAHDVRVVLLRSGIVLDPRGGVLKQVLPTFRLLIGGTFGFGHMFMPWIHWRDEIGLIDLALRRPELDGPLNATAPNPATNREFGWAIAAELNRPCWLPVPKIAARIALGEMANYVFMSQRVLPARARQLGYAFDFPDIDAAMRALLSPSTPAPAIAVGNLAQIAQENGESGGPVLRRRAAAAMPSRPIQLAAINVDGTLLRSDGMLHPDVIEACRLAERAGCVIVLATSRPPRGLTEIHTQLELHSPTINYNGAVIWNPLRGHEQYHEALPADVARPIVDGSRGVCPEVLVGVEVLNVRYTDRQDPAFGMVEGEIVCPLDDVLSRPITRLDLFGPADRLAAVKSLLRDQHWAQREISMFDIDPQRVSVMNPMVDKAVALQRIARRMNVTREQVMAIGATRYDQGMIEWAGFGVATGNAPEHVRRLADAVVPSNDAIGVAHALHRYIPAHRT